MQLCFLTFIEESFYSVNDFESKITEKGERFGVIYQKHHGIKNNQYYMLFSQKKRTQKAKIIIVKHWFMLLCPKES